MKAALLIGVVALVMFVAGVAVGYYHLPPFEALQDLKRRLPFSDALSAFMTQLRNPVSAPDVVMFGDSLTAGGDWPSRFPRVAIANLALNGNSSAGVLNQFVAGTFGKPRLAFLMVGVNDLSEGIPIPLIASHVELIATRLAANGVTPIVQSVLFVSSARGRELNGRIGTLNEHLREWCGKNQITFIDLNRRLAPDGALPDALSLDGLHLNDKGYELWADVIRPHVDGVMRERAKGGTGD